MTRYRWFYYRFRTMSLPEVGFRLRQYVQKRSDRSHMNWQPVIRLAKLPASILFTDNLGQFTNLPPLQAPIFNHKVDLTQTVDWHLDLSTGRRFPLTYAKDIDIRTGEAGNAKYVWEVNRMPFLPALALAYRRAESPGLLARFMELIESWAQENPYLVGVNWYSNIEVNLRLINWFYCWNILNASQLVKKNPAFSRFVERCWVPLIYQHCVYSRENPSHYSSANNHLIAEYAGLFIAGSFWQFPEADEWTKYAKAGLEREIQLQHRRGINLEQTATYIQFITDFFLIAYVVGIRTNNAFSFAYTDQLRQIAIYISVLLDCRGNLPNYGDQDNGRVVALDNFEANINFRSILASAAVLFFDSFFKQCAWSVEPASGQVFDLKNYLLFGQEGQEQFDELPSVNVQLGSGFYTEEGHFILRKQDSAEREIYIYFDAAPLGFLSIAAHGHADALSFCLHIDGCPFFVDPGTYTYHTESAWRNYFVSTRAHNTVCIDGENQAFQGGALLWLNHYQTNVTKVQSGEWTDEITATHTGYERLACRHERALHFDKSEDRLLISDRIVNYGTQDRQVELMFHLHPDVFVTQLAENHFELLQLNCPDRLVRIDLLPSLTTTIHRGETEPEPLGWFSERFYRKQPTSVIRAMTTVPAGETIDLQSVIQILTV
nr:alginate lyase family protein [uncultured Arsenicibacter sp.]